MGYKQQAATYYVESVGDNHTNASASAVVDVNIPISLGLPRKSLITFPLASVRLLR